MKFELEETLRGAPDEEILDDLRRVAKLVGKGSLTSTEYEKYGKVSKGTISRRFGSWLGGLEKAGLVIRYQRDISNDELFKNLEQMWIQLGRQPRYSEFKFPFSKYSTFIYEKRFGKFSEALKQFVVWVNTDPPEQSQQVSAELERAADQQIPITLTMRRTRREISDRLRFRILVRDGFRCIACGASPLLQPGVELHIDHILPWSKGGETIDENLECKCKQCNLGKGNAFNV